jgi:hypothetical protein
MKVLLTLLVDALALTAGLLPTSARAQFCLTDGFGKAWDITLSNNFLTGLMEDDAPFVWDVAGARGTTNVERRHLMLAALNPNRGGDPGCGDGAGFADWFAYNGRVTPTGGGTYDYSGDWVNACGFGAEFTGTLTSGTCPAPRRSTLPANDPGLSPLPRLDGALRSVEADTHRLSVYPNPVASAATIAFEIPATAHVRLALYDVLGREVAVLLDEVRVAGSHIVPFEASSLPAGIYVSRIEAGAYSASERLVLAH